MDYVVLAIARVIGVVLNIYFWIVIVSALITWVNPDPYNPIVRFLRNVTEPLYYRIRKAMPFVVVGGFDLTPIIVILAIQVLELVVVGNLTSLAISMR